MMKRNIIIDTDIGIDDAFAIIYASLAPHINILGLTSVYGNIDIQTSTQNALYLKALTQLNCPVAKGANHPLFISNPNYAYHVHGQNGLGDVPIPKLNLEKPSQDHAVQLMAALLEAYDKVTIVAIGPLTNVAMLLMQYPQFHQKIEEILIMGGSFIRGGNVTPVAEANIYNDPHSAEIVFRSSCKIKAFGLDVTQYLLISRSMLTGLSSTYGSFLSAIADPYINFYSNNRLTDDAMICHDLAPFFYLEHPDAFEFAMGRITVSLDGLTKGQTIFEQFPSSEYDSFFFDRPAHNVALQADGQMLIQKFLKDIQ